MKKLSPLYIVAVYFLVSLLWLVSSDFLIYLSFPEHAYLLKPVSNISYLIISSLLLLLLIRSANRQVKISDSNYRNLFDQNPHPIWVYDAESLQFLAVNKAAQIHYGFTGEEFLNLTQKDIRPEEDVSAFLKEHEEVLEGLAGSRLWRHKKKDGSVIYTENNSRLIAYKGKQAVLVLSHDITDRITAGNRLRYHEELLQNIFDRTPVGICLTSPDGIIEEVNNAFCAILESGPGHLAGNSIGNYTDGQDQTQLYLSAELPSGGGVVTDVPWQELRVVTDAGNYRWVMARGVTIRDVHNNPRIALFLNDITEAKKAAEEREVVFHELQNYKEILDKSALVSVTDLKGDILHANDLFCRVAGYTRAELCGRNHRIINSGHHPRSFFRHMWQTIRTGKLWRGEIRNRAKNGTFYWVDTIINPIFDEKGRLIQYLSIRYDITGRKNSEERIRRSEAALKEAQTLARIGNWEYNIVEQKVNWSDEVFNIHGIDRENGEPGLEDMQKLYHPDDIPLFRQLILAALSHGIPYNQDFRILMPGGGTRYINIIGKPESDESGRIIKLSGTIIDINERKMVEQHLQAQNEELIKINEELDRFVYSAGHDLRAPLMSVLGLINIAQTEDEGLKKNEYMELMRRSIHKLDEFIKDIIHFSRNARTALIPEPIDFKVLLEEVVDNLVYMKGDQQIQTQLHVEQNGPFFSDPKRITVIFNNLLSNAYRYSDPYKEKPFVDIQVGVNAGGVHIGIRDNGIGIDQEHIDKIFLMFYRATESRSGSGLGLYIVQETVATLQGEIKVQSKKGEGTSVSLNLPNLLPARLSSEEASGFNVF